MRIEKADMKFVEFDARDVIMTSGPNGGGTVGTVKYYWISKSGVSIFNNINNSTYVLLEPLSARTLKPLEYEYAQYTVGRKTLVSDESGDFFQWSVASHINEPLSETEKAYLITDDEITNKYADVIKWLEGTAVRN